MSDRSMWKLLHILYTIPPGKNSVPWNELVDAGIDCGPDTYNPLETAGVISNIGGAYALTPAAQKILETCIVANRRWPSDDMLVDYPSAFVVMPFSEPWSDTVYRQMIQPAITDAALECVRGDVIVRVGDLSQNIWGALLHSGIIVADVSVANPNVFYELGLAHALGKDTVILRQRDSRVPADIGGAHYHEYSLDALDSSRDWLRSELASWAALNHVQAVKALRGK